MKLKYLIILMLSLFCKCTIVAQNIHLEGVVINKNTKKPIINVNIQILPNSRFGSITNEKGIFSITTNQEITALKFSHISYKTKIIKINERDFKDSILTVQLEPESYSLNEVIINDKKFIPVYKKYEQSVIDYAIYKNRIFLIVKDFSDLKVKMYSINESLTDTIFIKPPCKPAKLIIDFYGNMDIISTADSAYQVVLKNNKITILKPFPFSKLNKLQKLYDFIVNDKYYFSEFESIIKDKVDYGFVDTNEHKKIFYSVYDDDKVDYYYHEMCFINLISRYNHVPAGPKRRKIVEKYYNSNAPDLYLDKIWFYNNIETIFFHNKSNLYIIDNVHNKLLKFDQYGNFISEVKISCKNNEDKACKLLKTEEGRVWKNKVLIDANDNTKVYFFWKTGTKTELYSFNLYTGTISFIKTLPHRFPKKLIVYSDKLYYLYQKPGKLKSYGLFRTELY